MTLLAFEDQVKPPAPFEAEVGSPAVSAREKDLAEALLDSATSDFDLTRYRDDYAAKLARLVQQKTRRKVGKSGPAGAAVGDLMDALRQSLAQHGSGPRRRARSAKAPRRPARTRRRRGRP
jgi:non-homologous end joining protein Ku